MTQQQSGDPEPDSDAEIVYGREMTAREGELLAAAEVLRPDKSLERLVEHQKSVLSSVSTVGTLLTGFGAITTAVVVDHDTYTVSFGGADVPVVPLGTLFSVIFASMALVIALNARRPRTSTVNLDNLAAVDDWFATEYNRIERPTRIASGLLVVAVAVAILTAMLAGTIAIADPQPAPQNRATLALSSGEKVVAGQLGGSIVGVPDENGVTVVVEAMPPSTAIPAVLTRQTAYPDEDGTVAFDIDIAPVPAGHSLRATLTVGVVQQGAVTDATASFALDVAAPVAPSTTTSAELEPPLSDPADGG